MYFVAFRHWQQDDIRDCAADRSACFSSLMWVFVCVWQCEVCNSTLGHMKAGDSLWIYKRMVHCENCFDVTRGNRKKKLTSVLYLHEVQWIRVYMYLFTLLADKWWKHLELNIFFPSPTQKSGDAEIFPNLRRRSKHLIKRLKWFTAYHCVLGDMGSAVLFLQADGEFWWITHLSLLVSYL